MAEEIWGRTYVKYVDSAAKFYVDPEVAPENWLIYYHYYDKGSDGVFSGSHDGVYVEINSGSEIKDIVRLISNIDAIGKRQHPEKAPGINLRVYESVLNNIKNRTEIKEKISYDLPRKSKL